MLRKDLVNEIASKSQFNKSESEEFLTTFIDVVRNALINKEKITLVGFGNFEVKHRNAKNGVNPKTGAKQINPAYDACTFKPSKPLKDAINGRIKE